MHLSRRSTLASLSRWAALLAAQRVLSAPNAGLTRLANPRFESDPFALGVASGQPRPRSVVLWTRLVANPEQAGVELPPALIPVTWQVADDDDFARIVRSGTVLADPAQAHSVRVLVEHLQPARRYCYRFLAGGVASPVGRTRTAPAENADVDRLRLALASCQHYEQGWFTAHREIAGQDLDAVVFVGDYIYDSSNRRFLLRAHEAEEPCTLDEFRARHVTYKRDPDLQACHAAHPWILAWDDHEVRNDYAGVLGDEEAGSPQEFLRMRTAAYQAYFEHQPLAPDQLPGATGVRMHDRFRWGRLADLWMLDGRQYRSPQACNAPGVAGGHVRWHCHALADDQGTVLGADQERWLQDGLRSATGRWKLIGQSTQMSPWGLPGPDGRKLVYSDGWDGYPAARTRLLEHIATHQLQNVVFLGGDVHRHVAARLRANPDDPRTPVVASEFVTSSITTAGLPESLMSLIRRSNADILHARSDERGYMALDVTDRSLHCVARATGFPVLAHAQLHTQARFRVDSGRAGPQRE
ncbi:alkaline phosphatase D family protein [Sphaerotilus montanus]|uniref:alkaline phosphatase D family protein n=1 Tax=Sphaerotilus montanus TaxID=522889 RepID=UPI003FA24E1B